jgi:hypothetical protein
MRFTQKSKPQLFENIYYSPRSRTGYRNVKKPLNTYNNLDDFIINKEYKQLKNVLFNNKIKRRKF